MKMIDASRAEISEVIDSYIHNEKYRMVIKRRLLDGICYEPLAEEFDMSVRQIKNIVYKGENRIFAHIKSR